MVENRLNIHGGFEVVHKDRLHLRPNIDDSSLNARRIELGLELGVSPGHLIETGDAMALPLSEHENGSLDEEREGRVFERGSVTTLQESVDESLGNSLWVVLTLRRHLRSLNNHVVRCHRTNKLNVNIAGILNHYQKFFP